MSAEAGLGYSRVFNKVVPFGRLLAGEARTSSNQYMYSIRGSKTGLAMGLSAGVNYELAHHIGIRVIQLQNQYLPFGSLGSVYWSIGSGINYQLGTARTRE